MLTAKDAPEPSREEHSLISQKMIILPNLEVLCLAPSSKALILTNFSSTQWQGEKVYQIQL